MASLVLPRVGLDDALRILLVIADQEPDNYERAAVKWIGRLALERPVGLDDIEAAVKAIDELPDSGPARNVLEALARRISHPDPQQHGLRPHRPMSSRPVDQPKGD